MQIVLNFRAGADMRLLLAGILSCAFFHGAAAADYCLTSPIRIFDGATAAGHIKVVVADVPRPAYPGHSADRPWCLQQWSSLGLEEMPTVIEKPSLGEVHVNRTVVSYKGNKIGHDHFVIEKTWYGRNNELFRAKVAYDVDVVAAPF